MWAAVPTKPEVVTVPKASGQLSELAADGHLLKKIVMSLVPEAFPPTGGTSWVPVSLMGALPTAGIPAHPAARTAAKPIPAQRDHAVTFRMGFMCLPPLLLSSPLEGAPTNAPVLKAGRDEPLLRPVLPMSAGPLHLA